MALTPPQKKLAIISGVLAVIAIIAAAFFLGRSGSDSQVATGTTPTATQTTPTQTQTVVTVTVPANTPPANSTPAPQILSMSVSPDHTTVGTPITFTVTAKGEPATVSMVYGASGGDISTAHNISTMLMESSAGGVTTWKTTVMAPKGATVPGPGQGSCFYTAVMQSKDGVEIKQQSSTPFYVT
ncbi:MAG: hypothetical protein ACYCXF_05495 [Thermoleophilia bacterium]